MRYDALFFDADETLFDFPAAERTAIRTVCAAYGLPQVEAVCDLYHQINRQYWDRFERGEVTQPQLRRERFVSLFEQLGRPCADLEGVMRLFTDTISQIPTLLPGAHELIVSLAEHLPLYIVTNGGAMVQHGRLGRSTIAPYIKRIFISEELGACKPEAAFFDRVFEQLGDDAPARARCLLLGDSLTSDMRGGRVAGLVTCWYNPAGRVPSADCDYEITSLEQFPALALAD